MDGREVSVRVLFGHRLTERAEVRDEVVQMYREAGGGSDDER